jgi:hypothetical protein
MRFMDKCKDVENPIKVVASAPFETVLDARLRSRKWSKAGLSDMQRRMLRTVAELMYVQTNWSSYLGMCIAW